MTNFIKYDLLFLALFTLFVAVFLYTRRHNLQRQGILYLYRTSFGLKVIDWFGKKFERILRPMQYIIVACGYILMVVMVWLLARITYLYFKFNLAEQIKVPPLLPLFPYATDLFKIDFLPPFYFTYWIIVIAIIAISHEFAHGIFAKLNNIKVKSTGFGFLGPFLAAFVEPDEKQMQKAKKFPQLSILAAGTFANVLMAVLFGLIMWLFFAFSFAPAGVIFNSYGTSVIELSSITEIDGMAIGSLDELADAALKSEENFTEIISGNVTYLVPPDNIAASILAGAEGVRVFEDAPAVRQGLVVGAPIIMINGERVTNFDELGESVRANNPGDRITITTIEDEEEKEREIVLGEKDGRAYLGIGVIIPVQKGISGWFSKILYSIKDPFTYYETTWNGDLAWFIYDLLWWIVIINISVALVNMLPVGIFDGGRFFYLTVWGITGRESWAKKAFSFTTWAVILIAVLLMAKWAIAFF